MTEDEEEVARALEAAEGGDAGHWPTVAAVLAAEVRRLRAALDRPGELGVLVCSERDGAPAVFRKATSAELRSALGPDPELVKWRKWAGALVGLDFEAIQPFTDQDLRAKVISQRHPDGARGQSVSACEVVERIARSIGKDVEVIFLGDSTGTEVQVAALAWSGCVVSSGLFAALTEAKNEGKADG